MTTQEKSRLSTILILKVILFSVIALVIGTCLVFFVKLKIDGRRALRHAKNVRLSLSSADIEMYGKGKCVYNPLNDNGLEEGAAEKAASIYEPDGEYTITSYDYEKHEITGMTYEEGDYLVTFWNDADGITWLVDYNLNIYTYEEAD